MPKLKYSDKENVEIYIEQIGERVRTLRARRGMTRRNLASHSKVSERYLAQIETGKANISVALLWRIAEGVGVDISELISRQEARNNRLIALDEIIETISLDEQKSVYELILKKFVGDVSRLNGIALLGLRGAGKTTIGELLSKRLSVPFVQLSKVIEEQSGMDIGTIFSLGGQRTYRRLEGDALEQVINKHEQVILETGGSVVSEKQTYGRLMGNFFTVWVRANPKDHMQRVQEQGDFRPMSGNKAAMDDLKAILSEREPYYRAAGLTVDSSRQSIDECLEKIVTEYRITATALN